MGSWSEVTAFSFFVMIAARNAAHKRVKAAIAAIVGVAELAFVGDPARIAAYQAHLPTRSATLKAPAPQA